MEEEKNKIIVYGSAAIQRKIYTIRDVQVMLDRDLANFYGVETKVLNQAVNRNIERFPEDFMFQLTKDELENWKSQIVTSNKEKMGLRKLPYVFTEQGVAMLSGVLRSETAIRMSIQIINAFVAMRKFIINNVHLFQRIDTVEKRQLKHEVEMDEKFDKIFNAMQRKQLEPKQGIFFNGQIFDAYKFVAGLIRKAEKSIVLIDNYIDETVLTLFSKRKKKVAVTIFTKEIYKALSLDITKFNSQYQPIDVKVFKDSHDRFMIIDNEDVYHFGASLKDLGKKWFAFSKFDKSAFLILKKLNDKNL
ncbi:MAG: ORF6N domain-containing protein [Bacteroidetes bacterium]|nr:ORF6N domain-containing protein [Bacteroidota bacterium]MBU2585385.1 ORF6N domain-containing protein [Bacteroidota bacterium]